METASGRQTGVAGRQPVSLPVGDSGARWRDPRHIQLFHAGGQGDQARALRGSLGEGRRLSYFFLAAGCSILSSWARMFLSLAPKKPSSSWSPRIDRKSTRLNSSHLGISYAVFCLKKNNN